MHIVTPDLHKIIGIFEEGTRKNDLIILSHGITSEKNEGGLYKELALKMKSAGYSSFRFDYRGHGDSIISSTDFTISGEILDLFSVLKYFDTQYNNIFLISASFASSITLLLFEHYLPSKLKKVVFLNPVTDYSTTFTESNSQWASTFFPQDGLDSALNNCPIKIGSKSFQISPQMLVELYTIKPQNVLWPQNLPLKIYHGYLDEIVSISDTKLFINKNKNDYITQVFYENAGHGLENVKTELFNDLVQYINE